MRPIRKEKELYYQDAAFALASAHRLISVDDHKPLHYCERAARTLKNTDFLSQWILSICVTHHVSGCQSQHSHSIGSYVAPRTAPAPACMTPYALPWRCFQAVSCSRSCRLCGSSRSREIPSPTTASNSETLIARIPAEASGGGPGSTQIRPFSAILSSCWKECFIGGKLTEWLTFFALKGGNLMRRVGIN